jgi:hypothetical protein
MAGVGIQLSTILHDLGGKLRNGSVKVCRFRQIEEFTFRHNTVREGVNDGAFGRSVRTGDLDGMVSQPLDSNSDVFVSQREAKHLRLVSFC